MLIQYDMNLKEFRFWGGAEEFVKKLTEEELTKIEVMLDDMYSEGMSATALNELFWYNKDTIAVWLGTTVEEIYARTSDLPSPGQRF